MYRDDTHGEDERGDQNRENPGYSAADLLHECRERLAQQRLASPYPSRPPDPWQLLWNTGRKSLNNALLYRKLLLQTGEVVWGHIVQANDTLFRPGRQDAPGEVIYCADTDSDSDPQSLNEVARRLWQLKGTRPADPAHALLARHLTNEYTRAFGVLVPENLCDFFCAELSTVVFVRADLPNRVLSLPFFPLLVLPNGVAMPVPSMFWPLPLVQIWNEQG